MVVLVLGFGPFGVVVDNPARRLALACGGVVGACRVVGMEMPVSYDRCERLTLDAAKALGPVLVVGVGVARTRSSAELEAVGRNVADPTEPDVDGVTLSAHADGPAELMAPGVHALAGVLGVGVSTDAGAYVCNSWLYRSLRAGLPAAFLHVPPEGFPPDRLRGALAAHVLAAPGLA